jgi:hypothetical protein
MRLDSRLAKLEKKAGVPKDPGPWCLGGSGVVMVPAADYLAGQRPGDGCPACGLPLLLIIGFPGGEAGRKAREQFHHEPPGALGPA